MTTPHPGVLAIWHDIEPGRRDEVLRWYDHEHHAERIGIPGFVRARRHSARAGGPELFIYYETESVEVLGSPDYLWRVDNPTDWTRNTMRHFRANVRSACRVVHRSAGPDGAYVGTARLRPVPGQAASLRERLVRQLFPQLREGRTLLGTQLWEADPELTTIHSAERNLRQVPDRTVDWVIVVSASTPEAVDASLAGPLSPAALEALGAAPGAITGAYRLDFVLEGDRLPKGSAGSPAQESLPTATKA